MIDGLFIFCGCPSGIRTPIPGTKIQCLAIRRRGNTMSRAKYKFLTDYRQLTFYFFPLILAHVSRKVIVRFNTSFSSDESVSTQK